MLATGQATLKQMLESKAYSQPARARLSFVSPHLDGREDHLPKPLGIAIARWPQTSYGRSSMPARSVFVA